MSSSSMFNSLLKPDLAEMIREQDAVGLAEFCKALHPAVTAEVLGDFTDEEVWQVLDNSSLHRQVEILEYLPVSRQAELVQSLDRERLSSLLQEMASDDRVDLLERLDDEQVEKILSLLAQTHRSDIRKLLSFPEGCAGSIMTTEYASLPENITVGEALHQLRIQAPNSETIYYIYVIDSNRRLRGFVSLRQLIMARVGTLVSDIMDREVMSVRVEDDQEAVAQMMARYDFLAVPVVDQQNQLVGIITHDDIVDVLQQEATEDAHRIGAVAPLEDSYLNTPIFTIAWKRGGWLVFLYVAAFITSHVLRHFKHVSLTYEWLDLFIPLVIASGGNAGSQTATLVIRTMTLGEVNRSQNTRLVLREICVGLLLGACLAFLGFVLSLGMIGPREACVVSITTAMVVVTGTLIGAMLPLIVKQLGMDPALMSTPLIAALLDAFGIVMYYSMAILIMSTA
ncbi:MAG: magnesium transporter [Planctomycetales bacterium]